MEGETCEDDVDVVRFEFLGGEEGMETKGREKFLLEVCDFARLDVVEAGLIGEEGCRLLDTGEAGGEEGRSFQTVELCGSLRNESVVGEGGPIRTTGAEVEGDEADEGGDIGIDREAGSRGL